MLTLARLMALDCNINSFKDSVPFSILCSSKGLVVCPQTRSQGYRTAPVSLLHIKTLVNMVKLLSESENFHNNFKVP